MIDRTQKLIEFAEDVFGCYSIIEYVIKEQGKSKEFDEFEMVISLNRSFLPSNKIVCSFQVYDDCVELLKDDCFYETDELDFAMHLFLTVFIEEPKNHCNNVHRTTNQRI